MEQKLNIKAWAEEDRPREKLVLKGKHALSDAELIAILIRSGNAGETAVELSRKILHAVNNDLHQLARLNLNELKTHKGIGEAKALCIIAALELGKRRRDSPVAVSGKIHSSTDAVKIFQPLLGDLLHEEFWILMLNRANHIIGRKQISIGGMTGTVVDPRIVFKAALDQKANSIILCHNHPSGNIKPSEPDLQLTRNLVEAGKVMEITVLDHLIITQAGFYSFADEGKI